MIHQIIKVDNDIEKLESHLYSWDLEDLTLAERFFDLAKAYLACSSHLFKSFLNEALTPINYSHSQVAAFLFEHSIELFLKGAIIQAGKKLTNTHYSEQLYNEFKNLYPGKKFTFKGKIEEATKDNPYRPNSEYARYPIDSSKNLWPGNSHIVLEIWLEQVELFERDFEELIPLIKERYPKKSS
jgi:HEPN domain-containing protein